MKKIVILFLLLFSATASAGKYANGGIMLTLTGHSFIEVSQELAI